MVIEEIATQIALSLIKKSGVREWDDPETVERITNTSLDIAAAFLGMHWELIDMALPDVFRWGDKHSHVQAEPPLVRQDSGNFSPGKKDCRIIQGAVSRQANSRHSNLHQ